MFILMAGVIEFLRFTQLVSIAVMVNDMRRGTLLSAVQMLIAFWFCRFTQWVLVGWLKQHREDGDGVGEP